MTQSCGLPRISATLGSAADAGCIITAASITAGIVTFGMMHSLFTAPAECKQILETFVAVQQALADGALPALGSPPRPPPAPPPSPPRYVPVPHPVSQTPVHS